MRPRRWRFAIVHTPGHAARHNRLDVILTITPMTKRRRVWRIGLTWAIGAMPVAAPRGLSTQSEFAWQSSSASVGQSVVSNGSGLRVFAPVSTEPRLRIVLPGSAESDQAIEVLVPEHVTGVKQGSTTPEQLYLFLPGAQQPATTWRVSAQTLEYQRDLPGNVQLRARATLEDDGVRFLYEFMNGSNGAFSMITAVTDPRLTGIFHDVRLERTYVHHPDGLDLLASEVPERITMPLARWLPARVLASVTWPVPGLRREQREGGLTHYNKSRAADLPFIATRSADDRWVVASVAREAGNVWSNPELTCQHVDPQTSLPAGQRAAIEVKLLVLRGTVNEALKRAIRQRGFLK